jgi:cellulose biosynthesis protein BcsQ
MRSLAIVARKGGAGKSTMAIHLAVGGFLRDRFVLLADMEARKKDGRGSAYKG